MVHGFELPDLLSPCEGEIKSDATSRDEVKIWRLILVWYPVISIRVFILCATSGWSAGNFKGFYFFDTNYELRHLVTRMAVHGFHHKICATKYFHKPGPDCACELCDTPCARYHVLECKNRGRSLIKFCTEDWGNWRTEFFT